jgi:hypothetical protein
VTSTKDRSAAEEFIDYLHELYTGIRRETDQDRAQYGMRWWSSYDDDD